MEGIVFQSYFLVSLGWAILIGLEPPHNTHAMNPPKIEDDLALKTSSGEKLKLQMIANSLTNIDHQVFKEDLTFTF